MCEQSLRYLNRHLATSSMFLKVHTLKLTFFFFCIGGRGGDKSAQKATIKMSQVTDGVI